MPVRGVLIQLGELPVHRVDVHVVVLLKVLSQQLHRVVAGVQAPLALEDFLHLQKEHTEVSPSPAGMSRSGSRLGRPTYPETLLGGEEARRHGVVLVELQQHVLQPVPHPQGELHQLGVHTLGYD